MNCILFLGIYDRALKMDYISVIFVVDISLQYVQIIIIQLIN